MANRYVARRDFLRATSALAASCLLKPAFAQESGQKREVAWLSEIQQAPAKTLSDAQPLAPLLVTKDGKRIESADEWKARREELRQWWLDFLGPMPSPRQSPPVPPKLEIVEEDRPEGVVRQLVRYEVEPGISTEAYLLKPARLAGKAPGVVALHSTVEHSIRQPAGIEGSPEKAFGLRLARRGVVVFCPRNFLWPVTGKISAQEETKKFLERSPKSKGMAKMLFDSLVAVDILAGLSEVDPQRLGAVGHSLGAKESLYLAAFDERIKVAVSSEGGIGTKFSNWDALWYLGPTIREKTFMHEHHELLALAAPRPFLLVGGESADGDKGWPFIEAALPVYELFGKPARLGQFNHRMGHAVPPEAERRIEEWLMTYL